MSEGGQTVRLRKVSQFALVQNNHHRDGWKNSTASTSWRHSPITALAPKYHRRPNPDFSDLKFRETTLQQDNSKNIFHIMYEEERLIKDRVINIPTTERRGRVGNTPASHSGGPGFKSRSGDRLFWYFSCFSSVPSDECRDTTF
jgi:hypothetical protein